MVRITATYAVVAWVLVQVASVMFPTFGVPDWGLRLFVLISVLALPVVLALSWPSRAPAEAGDQPSGERRPGVLIDSALMVLMLTVAGFACVQILKMWPEISRPQTAAAGTAPALSAPQAEPNSIAVLPFAVFSGEADDGYFADGLTEEVLNSLAQIDGLRVAGRTSSFYFKDRNEDLREIAAQLGVRYVLEGSVRRAGERMRITAQLVEADSGFHLWSETYDREELDVLSIQSNIAREVASVLEVQILGTPRPAQAATENEDAQRNFLIGLARLRKRMPDDIIVARKLFEEAIRLDPDFALAHAHLSTAFLLHADNMLMDKEEARIRARAEIDRALVLAPNLSEAHAAEGLYHLQGLLGATRFGPEERAQRDRAEAALLRAIALDERNAEAHMWHGLILMMIDEDIARALTRFQTVMALEPLFLRGLHNTAMALAHVGRVNEARALFRQVLSLHPDNPDTYLQIARFEGMLNRRDKALLWTAKALAKGANAHTRLFMIDHFVNLGDVASAREILPGIPDIEGMPDIAEAVILIAEGEYPTARAVLTAARDSAKFGPVKRQMLATLDFQLGRDDEVLAALRAANPELFSPRTPELRRMINAYPALMAAIILKDRPAAEDRAQARRLLKALLETWKTPESHLEVYCFAMNRAVAYAQLGKTGKALAEIDSAAASGMITATAPLCANTPTPMSHSRFFAPLREEPAFRRAMETMAEGAKAQLARVNDNKDAIRLPPDESATLMR